MTIIRTTEEFLDTFQPGDTIYYTGLFRGVPCGVIEVPYVRLSRSREEYPEIAYAYSDDHDPLMVCHTEVHGSRQVDYVETMLMSERICASTSEEAHQGLRMLRWMYDNDAQGREELRREWDSWDEFQNDLERTYGY